MVESSDFDSNDYCILMDLNRIRSTPGSRNSGVGRQYLGCLRNFQLWVHILLFGGWPQLPLVVPSRAFPDLLVAYRVG